MYFSFGYSVKLHPWQLSRAEIHSLCRQSANLFLKYFLQFGVMSGSLAFWRRKVVPSTWCHRLWQGIAKWSDSFSFFMISLSHVTPSSPPAPSLLPHFTDFHLFDPFPQNLDSWWDAPSNKHTCCSDSNRGTPWLELLHNYHREVGMCNLELPINLNPLTGENPLRHGESIKTPKFVTRCWIWTGASWCEATVLTTRVPYL